MGHVQELLIKSEKRFH